MKEKTVDDNLRESPEAIKNYEGGLAFEMKKKTKLATMSATCFYDEPKFYKEEKDGRVVATNQDHILIKTAREVAKQDKEFLPKLAAYLRNELYMRKIASVLWVEAVLAHPPGTPQPAVRKFAPSILKRADEPGEAMAYFISQRGELGDGLTREARQSAAKVGLKSVPMSYRTAKPGVVLPHSIRKGINDAVRQNFDQYQISKYNTDNADVKMRDVIHLASVKPVNKEMSKVYKSVFAGTIPPAETWEDQLMRWKEKGFKSKKAAWEAIIPKMGYMALMRNLRNFLQEEISVKSLEVVINRLTKPEAVRNSKQFPYRFYTAWKSIQGMPASVDLQNALEKAIDISMDNLPRWDGISMLSADWSGSMDSAVSEKSVITRKEVGALLMCMASRLCEKAICSIFGDAIAIVNAPDDMEGKIIKAMNQLIRHNVGSSTNAWLAIDYMVQEKVKVKRWVCLSDCQAYNSYEAARGYGYGYGGNREQVATVWQRYKSTINPGAFCYSIDLAGYGTSMVPEDDNQTCLLGGWSDKVLSFVPLFEKAGDDMVGAIERVTPEKYAKQKPIEVAAEEAAA